MSVDKIILRAVRDTLAAIAILFVFMLVIVCSVYPSTMMELTYDMGMDSASIKYAKRAYKRTDEVYYIAYATEVAIGMDDDEKIISCGEGFIADDDFAAYCEKKNANLPEGVTGTYEQYIYGHVCVAMYKSEKKQAAVERAFELVGNAFPKNNAIVALVVEAMKDSDTDTLGILKGKIEQQVDVASLSEADELYCNEILALMEQGNG